MRLVKDWITLKFLRVLNAMRWPTWLLALIGVVVLPPIAVYSYCYWVARILRSSE